MSGLRTNARRLIFHTIYMETQLYKALHLELGNHISREKILSLGFTIELDKTDGETVVIYQWQDCYLVDWNEDTPDNLNIIFVFDIARIRPEGSLPKDYFIFECNEPTCIITTEKEALECIVNWTETEEVYEQYQRARRGDEIIKIDFQVSIATLDWTKKNMPEEYAEYFN